jgi:hypothetical protein
MKKIISLILLLLLLVSVSTFLAACGNDAVPVPDSIDDTENPDDSEVPDDPLEGGWEGRPIPIAPIK